MAPYKDMNKIFQFCIFTFVLFSVVLISTANYSFAQESAENDNITLRFGKHQGYERIVLEGQNSFPSYELKQEEGNLVFAFRDDVNFDLEQITGKNSAFLKSLDVNAEEQLTIAVNSYDNIRELQVGNKLILDIYGTGGQEAAIQNTPEIVPEEKKEENKPDDVEATPKKEEEDQAEEVKASSQSSENKNEEVSKEEPKEESKKPAEEVKKKGPTRLQQAIEEQKQKEPHALTLSSTEGIRLGAFMRFGFLWVVADRIDLAVPPVLEGPNPELFGEIKEYRVNDGSATMWQLKVPDDFSVVAEGGALFWRFVISPSDKEHDDNQLSPMEPSREGVQSGKIRSGQLVFPLSSEKKVLNITDPLTGEKINVVAVNTSEIFTKRSYSYIDLDILQSPAGIAILPKNEELEVTADREGVTISQPEGLALSFSQDVTRKPNAQSEGQVNPSNENRLFKFNEWQMGGENALEENQRLLQASIRGKSSAGKAERLINLAQLNLAHGRGAEAKGFLRYASSVMPALNDSVPYMALRGASSALTGQYDLSLTDFVEPALDDFQEIQMWKSYAFAKLGDWQQAINHLPKNFDILNTYPTKIANPMTLTLAEVALRNGDKLTAEALIVRMKQGIDEAKKYDQNGLVYLEGEIHRQNGETNKATENWQKLKDYEDDFHHTKAELSLVTMGLQNGTLPPNDAMDRLEKLRFMWRGDDLEIQVLRRLGLSQIESEQFIKGFQTLRDTVILSPYTELSDQITALMLSTYENIFLTDKIQDVSPLDAAMLYEEFRELTPSGEKGDRLVARLAERLVDADLLGRAEKLLDHQVQYRLQGQDKLETAIRLAAIQLMDKRPEDSIRSLNKAEAILKTEELENEDARQRDIDLLRARALSDSGDVSASLNLLESLVPPTPDISRLEADVAWRSQRWDEAADALRELVLEAELSGEGPIDEENAELLLNYATTLNLSGGRIPLRNLRERHLDQMNETRFGQLFEVITRPRQDALLADRDTMQRIIAETSIFEDFLESYKNQ